jgi:hypothetical protein
MKKTILIKSDLHLPINLKQAQERLDRGEARTFLTQEEYVEVMRKEGFII